MSAYKDIAIEICDAMELVTGDEPEAMLDWLEGYEGSLADGVCVLLEGDSDAQDGPVVPMYELGADGACVLGERFRARLQRLLDAMTGGEMRGWAQAAARAAGATPESVMGAIAEAHERACE
ncbi:MAG: hypothetical protein SPD98_02790 [Tractidigestivibacter sp.]|uniref:hypothetical protein n=1 Tax=Tractidigestivibacter sp. TaxID=2847320 RepID=UPI002A8342F3|nr:hypothetical protein [Tractidigestivibacter sp.]MDY4534162.1 hypothetical protein [Tractidigestivibacter sp.]